MTTIFTHSLPRSSFSFFYQCIPLALSSSFSLAHSLSLVRSLRTSLIIHALRQRARFSRGPVSLDQPRRHPTRARLRATCLAQGLIIACILFPFSPVSRYPFTRSFLSHFFSFSLLSRRAVSHYLIPQLHPRSVSLSSKSVAIY